MTTNMMIIDMYRMAPRFLAQLTGSITRANMPMQMYLYFITCGSCSSISWVAWLEYGKSTIPNIFNRWAKKSQPAVKNHLLTALYVNREQNWAKIRNWINILAIVLVKNMFYLVEEVTEQVGIGPSASLLHKLPNDCMHAIRDQGKNQKTYWAHQNAEVCESVRQT